MTIRIEPPQQAVRQGTFCPFLLYGPSGSGKTYSSLLLARGLVGDDGKIGFVDTEARRSLHYSDKAGGFDVVHIGPPFTPERYIEALNMFEPATYKCVVIDSVSHEWEGEGGCVEIADATGKHGLQKWLAAKARHKKFVNHLLQRQQHVICCARAKEKSKQVKDPNTGKDTIVSDGIHPLVEKNFKYEMIVSIELADKTHLPTLIKCPDDLVNAFPPTEKVGVKAGQMIAEWVAGGEAVDHEFEALKIKAAEAASAGTAQLQAFWGTLTKAEQFRLKPLMESQFKPDAIDADDHKEEPPNEVAELHQAAD